MEFHRNVSAGAEDTGAAVRKERAIGLQVPELANVLLFRAAGLEVHDPEQRSRTRLEHEPIAE